MGGSGRRGGRPLSSRTAPLKKVLLPPPSWAVQHNTWAAHVLIPHTVSLAPLATGDTGTAQTVAAMRAFVEASRADPLTRAAVLSALHGAPEKSGRAELAALLDWTRERVRFLRDPVDVEYVQSPVYLLDTIRREGRAVGDCDDLATLYATLAEGAGYPTRFLVQGPPGDDFSHVIVEVDMDGRWVPVDPSQRGTGLGWRPRAGMGREAVEMRRRLGQVDWSWGDFEPGVTGVVAYVPEVSAPAPLVAEDTGGGFFDGLSSFMGMLTGSVKDVLPVLERYGVAKPVTGYTPGGAPIYATATLPVGGAPGAAFTTLTQAGPLGLSLGAWLLIGAGGLLLLVSGRRR